MKKLIGSMLAIGVLSASTSFADVHYSLNLVGRTKPATANPTGTVAYDGMLWGEYNKEKPLYGFYRVGARAGGNPSYGAFVQISPIAPLVFEVAKGTTNRFLKINTLDCDQVECKGKVDRTDYIIRAAAAKGNWVFLGSALWRDIKTEDSPKTIGLEAEFFVVPAGTTTKYTETSFTLGHKLGEDKLVGVMVTNGSLPDYSLKNSSAYAIYRDRWTDYNWAVGAGSFRSDMPDQDGFSAIFSISRTWGDRLSLF